MQFMETLSDAVDVSEFATFGSEFEKEDNEEMQWADESVYEKSAYIKDDDGWLNDGDWDYKSDSEDIYWSSVEGTDYMFPTAEYYPDPDVYRSDHPRDQ